MRKKHNLTGRKEKICEDWTWRERKMKWKLERTAIKKKGKLNKV